MLTRRCLLAGTLATFAAPLVATAQPPTKPAAVQGLISVLTEDDLRDEPYQCECEFYRGKDAIGNTVFATRRHQSVAFIKIEGIVTRLAPGRVSDLDCERGRSYAEEWRGGPTVVKLQFRAAGTGEEACWYQGRLTVETGNRTEALSVSGSCGC
jgi:hypothetical protein